MRNLDGDEPLLEYFKLSYEKDILLFGFSIIGEPGQKIKQPLPSP